MAALPPRRIDPVAEVGRNWNERWGHGDHLAASTAIQQASQLIIARIRRELEPFGLSFASYEALMLLSFTHGGALDQRSMGRRLMVQPASISNTVNRLEERALVKRVPDDHDGRRVVVTITEEGQDLVDLVSEPLQRIRFGIADFSDDEVRLLNTLFRRLREMADEVDSSAPNPWTEADP
jgi:DNA-binding MarR family transcriptional regulator